MVCLAWWSDFPPSDPGVGELGRNYGLAKAGVPAQAFYEKVAKGRRLEFQPISSVLVSTQRVDPYTVM